MSELETAMSECNASVRAVLKEVEAKQCRAVAALSDAEIEAMVLADSKRLVNRFAEPKTP